MDEKKLEIIEEIAEEYFDVVSVTTDMMNVMEYDDLVYLRGIYQNVEMIFDFRLITRIYKMPIFHMKKELHKIFQGYFEQLERTENKALDEKGI